MTAEVREYVMKQLHQRLKKMGFPVDDLSLHFRDDTLKRYKVANGDELLDKMYNDGHLSEFVDDVEREFIINYFNKRTYNVGTNSADLAFMHEPSEKALNNIRKQRLGQWKAFFDAIKKGNYSNVEKNGVPCSQEDWKIVENLLNRFLDMQLCYAKLAKIIIKNVYEVKSKTDEFISDVAEFEADIKVYKDKFHELQKTTKNIDEFEQKFSDYVKADAEAKGGTLEDGEKFLQQEKKSLDGAYSFNKASFQKENKLWNEYIAAKQKLEDYQEQVKDTKVYKTYGTSIVPKEVYVDIRQAFHAHKRSDECRKIYEQGRSLFEQACDRQLGAKQELKLVNAEITTFKKVSRERA